MSGDIRCVFVYEYICICEHVTYEAKSVPLRLFMACVFFCLFVWRVSLNLSASRSVCPCVLLCIRVYASVCMCVRGGIRLIC